MNWLMMTKSEIEYSRPVCVLCDMMILDDSYQGVLLAGQMGSFRTTSDVSMMR